MKKFLGIVVLSMLLSGNAYAAKRVCVAIHNQYLTIDKPVLLAKRKMLFDAVGCQKGNDLTNIDDYTIYKFKGRDTIFKKLYPNVIGRGVPNWDRWSLDELEKALGEIDYKFFNLPTSQERKIVAEKKKKEKRIADQKKKTEKELKDLAATLINKGLEIGNKRKYFFYDRNDQGILSGNLSIKVSTYGKKFYYFTWDPISASRFDYILEDPDNGSTKSFSAFLDWKNLSATIKDNNEVVYSGRIFKPKKLYASKEFKKIKPYVEPPKKKKPKQTPDDEKVVAAASGSGFFVSNSGDIITNHHVIEGCNVVKVNFKGSALEAKTLAIDKVNDIAILKAKIKPDKVYSVSNEDVSLLEDVVVAGYPLGKKVSSAIKTHKGVVTSLAGAGDNYSNFQTDATINQGNSGGPIMNQKGNVVGIAVATWVEEGVQGVHFGIKSSTLKTFASANGLRFQPPNNRDLSNKDLGQLITNATVYLECHMTIAKIKKMIAEANNRKAFFSEYQ